jgi:polyphosphate kinase
LRDEILADLQTYLNDTADAWELHADGSYVRLRDSHPGGPSAQLQLLEKFVGATR